jgi:hypothetical protein
MKIIRKIELSKLFFLFTVIWIITFIVFGIESAEGTQPTEDSNELLDTIYIIGSFTLLPILFYFLYKNINEYVVFAITPFLGMAMEWFLFRPADVLSESTTTEALAFFAVIWMVILIPPYYMTIISQKSKRHLYLVLIIEILVFIGAIVSLVV